MSGEMAQKHWDPPEHERSYYYHTLTGELGYLVRRDGQDCIRYDRPMQEIIRPFRPEEWNPKQDYRPMTRVAIAQVAFEADKRLCMAMGKHDLGRREWLNLRDEERIAWVDRGPGTADLVRHRLFESVMEALSPYAGT